MIPLTFSVLVSTVSENVRYSLPSVMLRENLSSTGSVLSAVILFNLMAFSGVVAVLLSSTMSRTPSYSKLM